MDQVPDTRKADSLQGRKARGAVSDRLRRFYADLTHGLEADTEIFFQRVMNAAEQHRADKPTGLA